MYNIKESSIEDYNSRKNEEMLYLNSIVSIISKDTPNLDNKIIDHHRLGKYDKNSSKIRPIKITFNNLQTKQLIINNAKNIKNSVYKHVNISMSLSKAEQIKLKELNTEAIHLSANNNDNIYTVRYLHNIYSIVKYSIKKKDNTKENNTQEVIEKDNSQENNTQEVIEKDNTQDNNTQENLHD